MGRAARNLRPGSEATLASSGIGCPDSSPALHAPGSIAVLLDPLKDVLLSEPNVGLDANVGDQAALNVAVEGFDVNLDKPLDLFGSQQLPVCSTNFLAARVDIWLGVATGVWTHAGTFSSE